VKHFSVCVVYFGCGGTRSTITASIYWPIVPVLDDDNDCGTIGAMMIGRETEVVGGNWPQYF
jgi:hypothetical protein